MTEMQAEGRHDGGGNEAKRKRFFRGEEILPAACALLKATGLFALFLYGDCTIFARVVELAA